MDRRKKSDYILYALGSRGSRPVHNKKFEIFGGQTTCFVVKHNKHAVIVDCGTGLYDAKTILSDCEVIDVVFTHVHYDHVIGLLDFSVFPKGARVNLIGTFKSWLSYDTIDEFYRHPFWPVQPRIGMLCEITNDGQPYTLGDDITLQAYSSNHPDAGNSITLNLNDKKVCFLFDVEINEQFNVDIVSGCEYLIFDGMFDDSEYAAHIGWGHSTYQGGCRLANICHCKELLITHHNPANNDETLLGMEKKAKTIFAKTRFVRAGDIYVIE